MKRARKAFQALAVLAVVVMFSLSTPKEVKSQSNLGFVPVGTNCFEMVQVGSWQVPVIVAFSSNCVVGSGRCLDGSCPTGSFEVQIAPV